MKKFLIILTFLISTVLVIDNVSALSYVEDVGESRYYMAHKWVGNSSESGNNCYYLGWFSKDSNITVDNYKITSDSKITYYKVCNYDNFIEFLNTADTSLVDATMTTNYSMSLNSDTSNMMYTNFDIYMDDSLYFAKKEYEGTNYNDLIQFVGGYNWTWKAYYGTYFNLENQKAYVYGSSQWGSPTETYSLETYPYWIGWKSTYGSICYSSDPFYYDTSSNTYKTGGTFKCGQSNLTKSSETSYNLTIDYGYEFVTNYDIYTQDGVLYNEATFSMDTAPTITISEGNKTSVNILGQEYITDVTLNIEFSNINNDKYLYLYKYGSDSNWNSIVLTQSNSFTKTYSENNTLYVQVISREDENIVSTGTYTVSTINYDLTPYITIDEITAETCILGEYTICQSLQINSHIADFSKYSFVIIDHTQNTTEKYTKEMTIYKTYYTNSTIEVRIIENETNSIFQTVSFTINTIDEETDNLGQYIKQECYFASIGTNYLCNYYFYNYKPDVYQYYYGTSTSEFEELKLETGTESVFNKTIYKLKDGLGKLQEVSYSENTTVYFKILNKETGELIHTQTFVISYSEKLEDSGKKDIFDIFKNFNNNNSTIKELIDNIWTLLKTSSIYEYIMILIVGTLIIVIIKAANR